MTFHKPALSFSNLAELKIRISDSFWTVSTLLKRDLISERDITNTRKEGSRKWIAVGEVERKQENKRREGLPQLEALKNFFFFLCCRRIIRRKMYIHTRSEKKLKHCIFKRE
jgi:hypothetical protein